MGIVGHYGATLVACAAGHLNLVSSRAGFHYACKISKKGFLKLWGEVCSKPEETLIIQGGMYHLELPNKGKHYELNMFCKQNEPVKDPLPVFLFVRCWVEGYGLGSRVQGQGSRVRPLVKRI